MSKWWLAGMLLLIGCDDGKHRTCVEKHKATVRHTVELPNGDEHWAFEEMDVCDKWERR